MKNDKTEQDLENQLRAIGILGVVGDFLMQNEKALVGAKSWNGSVACDPSHTADRATVTSMFDLALAWIALHKAVMISYEIGNNPNVMKGNETIQ
jgi:hypothetical protein